jgi:hypothetical protein
VCLQQILLEGIGKTPPLHDGQECGLALTANGMGKVIVHG